VSAANPLPIGSSRGSSSPSAPGCGGSTGVGRDSFDTVTALPSDAAGARIKLQQLKPAALLAGRGMFQQYRSLRSFQKYICLPSPREFW